MSTHVLTIVLKRRQELGVLLPEGIPDEITVFDEHLSPELGLAGLLTGLGVDAGHLDLLAVDDGALLELVGLLVVVGVELGEENLVLVRRERPAQPLLETHDYLVQYRHRI